MISYCFAMHFEILSDQFLCAHMNMIPGANAMHGKILFLNSEQCKLHLIEMLGKDKLNAFCKLDYGNGKNVQYFDRT